MRKIEVGQNYVRDGDGGQDEISVRQIKATKWAGPERLYRIRWIKEGGKGRTYKTRDLDNDWGQGFITARWSLKDFDGWTLVEEPKTVRFTVQFERPVGVKPEEAREYVIDALSAWFNCSDYGSAPITGLDPNTVSVTFVRSDGLKR